MLTYEGIARNFQFMVVQVTRQLEHTVRLLAAPDPRLVKSIQDGDDYIDTQKSMIENECFRFIRAQPDAGEQIIDSVRALNIITANLERIADMTVNIARQMQYLGDPSILQRFDYSAYLRILLESVGLISRALEERDSSLALRICHSEERLDRLYHADFLQIIGALRTTRDSDRLITVLFILHYLERMGDGLLNVGEAILFAILGERLKVHQYRVLDAAVAGTSAQEPSLTSVEMASIWGTRSGVRIGTLEETGSAAADRILFKEGSLDKLRQEKEALQRWGQVAPGVAPAVVEYQQREGEAALLLQYLDGTTLQEIALNAEPDVLQRAIHRLVETVPRIWRDTLRRPGANGRYIQQLQSRLADVQRLHPYLDERQISIGRLPVPSFSELLEAAAALETHLDSPFAVYIHGDFNLDNIIYNIEADTLHFVDVHRSRDMDYVQDVSVLLVSGFRQPVFVPRVRQNLETVGREFLRAARLFAAEQGDETFEARLALGLVRSFATSMRFELNRRFALSMQHRAVFLLRALLDHPDRPWAAFHVPDGVLIY